MDDMHLLRAVLARPELTEETAHRGRRRLQERIDAAGGTARGAGLVRRSHPGRRRAGWTAVTAGLTAAAAAAAVAMGSVGAPPGTAGPSQAVGGTQQGGSPAGLSGRDLLLAAAVTAASRPDGVGRYWHVVTDDDALDGPAGAGRYPQETWTERNGVVWTLATDRRGVWNLGGGPRRFPVAGEQLTFEQLQRLPADPGGLQDWISRSLRCSGYVAPSDLAGDVSLALAQLLFYVPASSGVRSAAFRALAAMPGVQHLGHVAGGEKLLLPVAPPSADKFPSHRVPAGADRIVLVIDPATSLLHSYTSYQGTTTVRTYEWTNRRPPGEAAPGSGEHHQPPGTPVPPPPAYPTC
jgi:hypothetical protein